MTSVICRHALIKAAGAISLARPAKATAGVTLPPEAALQPGKITYREGDHELMAGIFVGEVHLPQGDLANIFTTHSLVPGETAAGSLADTGFKMQMPSI